MRYLSFVALFLTMSIAASIPLPAVAADLLSADFNSKTLDAPIGTGGAAVGEPVTVSPNIMAIVRGGPFPTRSLEITDNNDTGPAGNAGTARFEFIANEEVTTGVITINADLWFDSLEDYIVYVREQATSAESFVNLRFGPSGNVVGSGNGIGSFLLGTYEAGRIYPISIVIDLDAATFDIYLDGCLVLDDQPHEVVGRGVGAVLFGTGHDTNLDGKYSVDNITVCEGSNPTVTGSPLELDVSVDWPELWPPNHKMVEICATVVASGGCGDAPTVELVSVTSNEPDNGKGDGNTVDDIQGVSVGTEDLKFMLRSERQGGGDGRKYTIIYSATDNTGTSVNDTVCVTVPHDQGANASAVFTVGEPDLAGVGGFSKGGVLEVVVPSGQGFASRNVVASAAELGNGYGKVTPLQHVLRDVTADGKDDLVLYYDIRQTQRLADAGNGTPVALRFSTGGSSGYLVSNLLGIDEQGGLIQSAPGSEGRDVPVAGVTPESLLIRAFPNPVRGGDRATVVLSVPASLAGGMARVDVFDIAGRRLRQIHTAAVSGSELRFDWDLTSDRGERLQSGVYFYRLSVGSETKIQKFLIVRN